MDDFGVPLFLETSICVSNNRFTFFHELHHLLLGSSAPLRPWCSSWRLVRKHASQSRGRRWWWSWGRKNNCTTQLVMVIYSFGITWNPVICQKFLFLQWFRQDPNDDVDVEPLFLWMVVWGGESYMWLAMWLCSFSEAAVWKEFSDSRVSMRYVYEIFIRLDDFTVGDTWFDKLRLHRRIQLQ